MYLVAFQLFGGLFNLLWRPLGVCLILDLAEGGLIERSLLERGLIHKIKVVAY